MNFTEYFQILESPTVSGFFLRGISMLAVLLAGGILMGIVGWVRQSLTTKEDNNYDVE